MIEQEQQISEDNQAPLPSHGQIQGQRVYLGGLDYNLLQQQKAKQAKKGIIDMDDIRVKLNLYSDRLNIKKQPLITKQPTYQNDSLVTNLIRIINAKNNKTSKPLIGINTSYRFDTRYNFGLLQPQIITRKYLKTNQGPVYVHFSQQKISQFRKLLTETFKPEQQEQIKSDIINEDDSDEYNIIKVVFLIVIMKQKINQTKYRLEENQILEQMMTYLINTKRNKKKRCQWKIKNMISINS